MDSPGEGTSRRKSQFFYSSDEQSAKDFSSDDSIKDRDYVESENKNSTSEEDSDTVSKQNMWLTSFCFKYKWLKIFYFVLCFFLYKNVFCTYF